MFVYLYAYRFFRGQMSLVNYRKCTQLSLYFLIFLVPPPKLENIKIKRIIIFKQMGKTLSGEVQPDCCFVCINFFADYLAFLDRLGMPPLHVEHQYLQTTTYMFS